ncbi:cobalamin biosynthesis protein CobQ [Methylococcaceae bacterium CS1]|nr:cobalamin biosynthesis protein CobQ [Methylococcaceae bacterium CS4]TXL02612.1 cobalamin biosynthesis protein CobQ [Methylococcaceae bacterium CS1]TXL03002.1 cobalamin biosynthesis protein CobQ [Methylococcaceae bacterium CS3]TXL06756.1 cobalamin biosynthesis protein CobQ [Methylococcaceae bacterium CS2]
MAKTISVFNNKGGVGKTSIIWNLAATLSEMDKRVLLIDFDPQCNLSIAAIGSDEFSALLKTSTQHPYGQTVKAFALPYIQQNRIGNIYTVSPKKSTKNGNLHIVPGDFWLNSFSDILNVGTDVIAGSGLYRFILPNLITEESQRKNNIEYDYVLIDLPPSFNTLVRSSLYCSDYFLVPCTPDLFSSYCVGLIGEMLPLFIQDWEQGKARYLHSNPTDALIGSLGKPQFGGWIFNNFDTRRQNGKKNMVAADAVHHEAIKVAVRDELIAELKKITYYSPIPSFADEEQVAGIEDINVMASDSLYQNIPLRYLSNVRPTGALRGRGSWAQNQLDLMDEMSIEYDNLAKHIVTNFGNGLNL